MHRSILAFMLVPWALTLKSQDKELTIDFASFSQNSTSCFKSVTEFEQAPDVTRSRATLGTVRASNLDNVLITIRCSDETQLERAKLVAITSLDGGAVDLSIASITKSSVVLRLAQPLAGLANRFLQLRLDISCLGIVALVQQTEIRKAVPLGSRFELKLPDMAEKFRCEGCSDRESYVEYLFGKHPKSGLKYHRSPKYSYLKNFAFLRPRVGESFEFIVSDINPFLYDVTVNNETHNNNQELSSLLEKAFSAGSIIDASGTNGVSDSSAQDLKDQIVRLGNEITRAQLLYQQAGECFDLCRAIDSIVHQVNEFFQHYGFDGSEPFETWAIKAIHLPLPSTDAEKAEAETIKNILSQYFAFRHTYANFSYKIPYAKNVDQYIFKLNIKPKPGITAVSQCVDQEVPVSILGGFKIDVSSGLFLTSLRSHSYTLLPDSTVIRNAYGGDSLVFNRRKALLKDSLTRVDFGIASFIHFYTRLSTGMNIAGSIGAGLSISAKPKISYLGGVSLLFGSQNRVALTAGWAAGFVDRLSDRYKPQTNNGMTYTSASETEVGYKKVFKTKHFFALTYNLPFGGGKQVKPLTLPEKDQVTTNPKDQATAAKP